MYIASEFGLRDAQARECVVSIGVFDGVHCGHGRVLGALREAGARHALPTVVVTFDPHPRLVLQPHRTVPMLVSLRHRLSLLTATGNVDRCVVVPFDRRQAEQSADDFVRKTLVERLGMRALVVGENFVCGRGRVGTVDYLRKLGERFGFAVDPVAMDVRHEGELSVPSSSTETRRLIQAGHLTRAAALLGRPHELECVVAGSLHRIAASN
jgi:riboflavin kinase/FMN adenylyltransferase